MILRWAILRTRDSGFTLIELLVVVLIIGILAAVSIPVFLGQVQTARESSVAAQVANTKTAIVVAMLNDDPIPDEGEITASNHLTGLPSRPSVHTFVDWVNDTRPESGFCVSAYDDGAPTYVVASDQDGAAAPGACVGGVFVPVA